VAQGSIFTRARDIVQELPVPKRRLWQGHDYGELNGMVQGQLQQANATNQPEHYLAALILQSPRSVMAQKSMDKHPHGFHDKEARLDELITFNDTYVSLILALPSEMRHGVNDQIKQLIDDFCRQVHAPKFSGEQWEAITHGLSREIAVYLGARSLGYSAEMTSRHQDAMGIDMVIAHATNGRSINVDIKTRSSFHFRLKDLTSEGRISEMQREAAEHAGFCMVVNGHGDEQVHTTLLRIDEETYGLIQDFEISRLDVLGDKIAEIMRY
jgi:hypothetical protein